MNILVKYEHYTSYINDNNNPYLDRKEKYRIYSKSKEFVLNGFKKVNEEVFDGIKTEYDVEKNGDNYLILFKSKSESDYKLELHKEPNTKIYHISFTLFDRNQINYEDPSDKGEAIEVYSRLLWILKDVKIDHDEYCIGATGDKRKDSIYLYLMKDTKKWQKRNTNIYPLGWALYFTV